MKRITTFVIVTVLIALGGVAYTFFPAKIQYMEPEVVEKEVTVEVEALDKKIAEALTASSTDIEIKARKAYEDAKEQAELEITTRVRDQYLAEIESINLADKKKLDSYWRSKPRIVQLIREYFPDDTERALAVAKCESGFNYLAKGPTHDGGVFQIHLPSHGKRLEQLGLDVWNPEHNVQYARMLYDEQKWEPWVCATKLGYN